MIRNLRTKKAHKRRKFWFFQRLTRKLIKLLESVDAN